MASQFTRRTFLSDAALLGVASALKLEPAFSEGQETRTALRRRSSFDSGWRFVQGDPAGASAPAFSHAAWRALDLPHDWSIEGEFAEDAACKGNGAYLPTGVGWYRKVFSLPAAAKGKMISIEFDGVYQRSEVWINGVSLGTRPYGFISFAYDLTPHLIAGRNPNVLAVRVDNSLQPNCRWYSGSGIYRHTWLRVTEPLNIARWGVQVQTPSISPGTAAINVTTRIRNEGEQGAQFEVLTECLDPDGNVLQQSRATHAVPPGGQEKVSATLPVVNPPLWSPGSPAMCTVRSTLLVQGREHDQEITPFGIRDVVFDVNRGLLLNGEHVKMNGVCLHGDGGAVGTAVPERIWERRLDLLREMGCNAIRLSHNPPTPELLDMLDRMGFLVMEESFDEWKQPKLQTPVYGYHRYFDEWSERDLAAMIERDRNHPSIVIWSLGNEVPDQSDPDGPATLTRLKEILHRSDITRPVTVACDQIAAEPKAALPQFLGELDVVGYNYVDRWRDRREKYYSIDRHAYPERRFIGTESSSQYGARGVYAVDQADDLFFERTSNLEIEVEQLRKFVQTYDYVSGDFIWAGIDYLGEARWPNKLAATGPLDTCGFRKDNFYLYQSLWTEQPVVHLFPHWNWPGQEGRLISVTCFTNCDTVELLLNGQSLGTKGFAFPRPGMTETYGHYPLRARALQTTADLHLTWDVPYVPGTLTARGTRLGSVVKTVDVRTSGNAAKLELTTDRTQIRTDPSDVAHVTVRVLDSNGFIVPTADNPIRFTLQGGGRLIGVDNGRPDSHERYQADRRTAFSGMALAILQSDGRPGSMVLAAESQGLQPAHVRVDAL